MQWRKTETEDVFVVTGDSGHDYEVNISKRSCTCPQYRIRLKGNGTCKHYTYLLKELGAIERILPIEATPTTQILNEFQEKKVIQDIDLIEKFGIEVVPILDTLISKGEIWHNKWKHTYEILT